MPAGPNPEMSSNTIESSLVTKIPREEFLTSTIDSLDNVPSLPIDTSELSSHLSSSAALPDPSPYLTYVHDQEARVCYRNIDIREVMQAKGIETLEERRLSRVDRFISRVGRCVFAAAKFPDEKGYKWEIKLTRKRSQLAEPYEADSLPAFWQGFLE